MARPGATALRRAARAAGLRLAVLGALLLAQGLATWLAPAPADAATPRSAVNGPLKLIAPRLGTLVTGKAVRVRVRTPAKASRFRAELVSRRVRDVTRRFRVVRPGLRVATLRVGRELRPGKAHLFVTVGPRRSPRWAVETHFVVARPAKRLVRVRGLRKGVTAPVRVRARVAAGARLRAQLNGRRVHDRFERRGRWRVAELAADDGLRFGRNRLVLTAFTEQGRYERLRRAFVIRRDRPLVGAGRDRRIRAGRPVRLDGSATTRSRRGTRLRLRWRIVDRPKGSKRARLRGARGPRPRLVTDVPGHYTVRLEATELRPARPGARARGASASAAAVSPTTADTVELAAQPSVLPDGALVRTIASDTEPGIQLGETFYPAWSGGWVESLVLDRDTLEVISVNTYTGNSAGTNALALSVGELNSEHLVIVAGTGRFAGLEPEAEKGLEKALTRLGVELDEDISTYKHGNFSVIGVPGTRPGSAHQCNLSYCRIHPGAVPGELEGSLQLDIKGNFAYNWPPTSYSYDTRAPGSSSKQNVMQVSGEAGNMITYESAELDQPGFQLLWLDSGTLAARGNYTYAASTSSCGGDGCLQDLAAKLKEITASSPPGLIMLSSFGRPTVGPTESISPWGEIAGILSGCGASGVRGPLGEHEYAPCTEAFLPEGMGANQLAFLGLDGTGDYTLVGLEGQTSREGPNSGAELSEVITGKPARLAGAFKRNNRGLWQAGTSGNPDPANPPSTFVPDLLKILQQPPEPFAFPQTAAEWAAERYIAEEVGLSPIDPTFGIRAAYWEHQSLDWASAETRLSRLGPCTADCPQGFDATVFREVRAELLRELPEVATVMNYMGDPKGELQDVLEGVYARGSYSFVGTAAWIRELLEIPAEKPPQGPNFEQLINGSLTIASGAAGFIPVIGGIMGAPFTVARGGYMIASALINASNGESVMEPSGFGGSVYEWGTDLQATAEQSVDGLGLVTARLVSDRGRLRTAADLAATTWAFTPQSGPALQESIARSLRQYMWTSMMPAAAFVTYCGEEPPHEVPTDGLVLNDSIHGRDDGQIGIKRYFYWPVLATLGRVPKGLYNTLFSRGEGPGNVNLYAEYFYAASSYRNDHNNPLHDQPTSPGFVLLPCWFVKAFR